MATFTASVLLLLCVSAASAALPFVSDTLGSNMVIPRAPASARLWGWTKPGAVVTATVKGNTATATADSTGLWVATLMPIEVSLTSFSISLSSTAGDSAQLDNVLAGDIFLCGGQSNMQMTVSQTFNASEEIAYADKLPAIRLFTVGQGHTSATPETNLVSIEQRWSVASHTSVGGNDWAYISAACWYFGRTVFEDVLNSEVPLGLMSSNWGGTSVQSWMTPDAIAKCPSGDGSTVSEATKTLYEDLKPVRDGPDPNTPTVLYNAMIYPLRYLSPVGAIWYQGEANTGGFGGSKIYTCLLTQMIAVWRNTFGVGDFPFLIVQLAPWTVGGTLISEMRMAQLACANHTNPGVGVATAADLGDPASPYGEIHPRDKRTVGVRLALLASDLVYNRGGNVWGPIMHHLTLHSESAAAVTYQASFVEVANGLSFREFVCPTGTQPLCLEFQLCDGEGTDAKCTTATGAPGPDPASILITGSSPTNSSAGVWVRYAFSDYPFMSVVNSNGLPAFPFNAQAQ